MWSKLNSWQTVSEVPIWSKSPGPFRSLLIIEVSSQCLRSKNNLPNFQNVDRVLFILFPPIFLVFYVDFFQNSQDKLVSIRTWLFPGLHYKITYYRLFMNLRNLTQWRITPKIELCSKKQWHKTLNYSPKKLHLRCLTGFWIRLFNIKQKFMNERLFFLLPTQLNLEWSDFHIWQHFLALVWGD